MPKARARAALLAAALAFGAGAAASAEVERIVAIGPAVSETVAALGAADRLVAVDSSSQYPPRLRGLPQVGYMRSLSAEGVLSLRPGVLLITADAGPPAALAQLRGTGLPVVVMPQGHSPATVLESIRIVGDAIGRPVDGRDLAQKVDAEFAALARALAARNDTPRVLFVLANTADSLMAAGRETAAESIIALAGGKLAIDGYAGYKPITAEAAVASAPDVILLPSHGVDAMGGLDKALKVPQIALTPAGRSGRVVVMEMAYLLGFGPRAPQAAADLARRLHPGLALPGGAP
ncbi:MAG: ABC transporter substrate-binding protein [Alphaproteobacteria bacterium]|nr:ABC transporter substrate-binding protein [Alphaproteobacteria bacterium]